MCVTQPLLIFHVRVSNVLTRFRDIICGIIVVLWLLLLLGLLSPVSAQRGQESVCRDGQWSLKTKGRDGESMTSGSVVSVSMMVLAHPRCHNVSPGQSTRIGDGSRRCSGIVRCLMGPLTSRASRMTVVVSWGAALGRTGATGLHYIGIKNSWNRRR